MRPQHDQRGVALLAAIILVAIAATIAASIAFQSAMSARRGIASLSFEHSVLVAQGAEALAAYGLKDDASNGDPQHQTDDYREAWAKPFGPMEIAPGVILEASLEDLAGRFNLNSLVDSKGVVDAESRDCLQRLLEALGLESKWADQIADWIDLDSNASGFDGLEDNGTTSQAPPYRTANTIITSTSELLALPGFGRERYTKLAPYVAALPPGTQLNLCTASGILLDAIIATGHSEYRDPEALGNNRKEQCYPETTIYMNSLQGGRGSLNAAEKAAIERHFSNKSDYFRLTSVITLGGTEFALYSLLHREGSEGVRVLQRGFTPD